MKNNLFPKVALLATGMIFLFSAFSDKISTSSSMTALPRYLTFDINKGFPQTDIRGYTTTLAAAPLSPPSACNDDDALCWFRVRDVDGDDDIDIDDFEDSFDELDTDNDNTLDDQNEQVGILDKKG